MHLIRVISIGWRRLRGGSSVTPLLCCLSSSSGHAGRRTIGRVGRVQGRKRARGRSAGTLSWIIGGLRRWLWWMVGKKYPTVAGG